MFEIWGTLNGKNIEKDKRLSEYFTHILTAEELKNTIFFPPVLDLWEERLKTEKFAIMTFKHVRHHASPYVTSEQLKRALNDFLPFREKILISLSPTSEDYNLKTEKFIPLTRNIAQFKAAVNCSTIFFDENFGCSYFTYNKNSPHLVWVEDTKSIAHKHNLIKSAGFKGIYWENPYFLLEGNWEALTTIYKKA